MRSRIPVILLNDTRADRHHGCTRVIEALLALLEANGMDVVASAPVHVDWRGLREVEEAFSRAKLVVVNGEGTLHHDRHAGRILLEAGAKARAAGIPAVLVNAGWEANGEQMFAMLRDFSLVAVRDSRSAIQIRGAGLACTIVPDLSLYLGGHPQRGKRAGIAFTDSVDRRSTLLLDDVRRSCNAEWLPIQSASGPRNEWRFVREGLSRSDLRDPRTGLRMFWIRNALRTASLAMPGEFIDRLAALELLVTGRFHACTLAMVAGTPFLATPSNTSKISALLEDAGLAAWRVADSLSRTEIEAARRTGWESGELSAISDYLASARMRADTLFGEIARMA